MSLPDVHYYRPYYGPDSSRGMSIGTDIIAFKYVLARAGFFKVQGPLPDNEYNRRVVESVKKLQKAAGITPITGYTGKATFEALKLQKKKGNKSEYAWDDFRVLMYNNAIENMQLPTEGEIRRFISDQLYITYKYREWIDYRQWRPVYPVVNRILNPALARRVDCSGEAIYGGALADWYYRKEGIRVPAYDPIYGNSGYGSTYSLITGGRRITRSETTVGDLVFYTGHVTTIVRAVGDERSVVSMGSNDGPLYLPDDYRSDIQCYRTYKLREVIK